VAGQNANWREIRRQLPLNEERVAMYRRLMDAEARLDSDDYLSALARDVAALGGHLEVRAVLPDETITLLGK
jgi:hypothetical protein